MKKKLRFPVSRYGSAQELKYYAQFQTAEVLARRLKLAESTVISYLSGKTMVPWWVCEILRLSNLEFVSEQRCYLGVFHAPKGSPILVVDSTLPERLTRNLCVSDAVSVSSNDTVIPKIDAGLQPSYKRFRSSRFRKQ